MYTGRQRKSPRLKGFDYASNAAFFVTICTHRREHLFGEIVDKKMRLNDLGDIVFWEWYHSEQILQEVYLDEFVIMPNHIHGIVFIIPPVGTTGWSSSDPAKPTGETEQLDALADDANTEELKENSDGLPDDTPEAGTTSRSSLQKPYKPGPPEKSLGSFVGGFKAGATTRINTLRKTPSVPIWQGRFHDEIIRNEQHLENVRQYIHNNPANWDTDEDNL